MQTVIKERNIRGFVAALLTAALVLTSVFTGWYPGGGVYEAYAAGEYPWSKTAEATSGNYIADAYGLNAADTVIENVPTDRLLDILSDAGTHYILFSNPRTKDGESVLPQQIVRLINEKAKALGVSKIYHYDTVLDDWQLDITAPVTLTTDSETGAVVGAVQDSANPASWGGSTLNKSTVTDASAAYAFLDDSASDIGGVNAGGQIATWVGRIWTFIKAKFPADSIVDSYTSGDVLLLRFNKATHQTLPSAATVPASAYFDKGVTYTNDAANAAIETAFKGGATVVKGDVRTQYEFFKRAYNINASYFNTNGAASANKTGTGVEIFKDSDFPNGQGFKFKAVTVPELYNILNSPGYKPVLFASTACHNTQAIIGSIALKAKTSTEPTVYVLEPSLSGTFLTGEGENIDKVRFSGATGGVHIRNNRKLTEATLSGYQYSYLYGEIGRSFIPNLLTEQLSKKSEGNNSGSIGYYQNGAVDNFVTDSSSTWTNTYPWATGDRKATGRLQIPYLLGYEKSSGQTQTWLHKKAANDGTYSEYMLDLTFVLGTDAAKALEPNTSGSDSVDLDGLQAVAFAQEAVSALDKVLPQQIKAFATAPTPTITGTVKNGQTLTAKPGTWSPTATLAYQWYADGKAISGATKATLKLAAAQVGKKITVAVKASATGYVTTTKISKATTAVKGLSFTKTPKPKITGTATVGKTLKITKGKWAPSPKFKYQWYANGKAIKGATKATLKLKTAQKGKKITVKVTASKAGYENKAVTSKATAKVKK